MRRLAWFAVVWALCACKSSDPTRQDGGGDPADATVPDAHSGGSGGSAGELAASGGGGMAGSAGAGMGGRGGRGGAAGMQAGGVGGSAPNPPVDAGADAGPPPAAGYTLVVGVSDRGMRGRSTDGKAWTYCANPGSGDPHSPDLLRNIAYGDGVFVAVGGDANSMVMRSLDGEHWQEDLHPASACSGEGYPASCKNWMGAVAYHEGVWLAGGGNAATMRSTDGGLTWKGLHPDFSKTKHIRSMAAGAGRFVAGTDGGGVFVTRDGGDSWEMKIEPSNKSYPMIEYGAGMFVAHANPEFNAGDCYVSTNAGDSWTPCADAVKNSVSFVHDGARWVSPADGGYATSTDGKAWTLHAASSVPAQLLYEGGTWFGRTSGNIYTGKSPDTLAKVAMGVSGYRGWIAGKVLDANLPVTNVSACTDAR